MSTSETITRTDLTNILNEVLPVTSKVELEYAGNVSAIHWSSWTAIDDGIVVIDIGWLTNGSFGYYYVKDNTDDIYVGKVTTYTANGTSNTTSFPVLKGHTYQVANLDNVDGSHIYFRYYKYKNPTATCGLADFIVEQGTSGIWTYRKWNSGIAECWGEEYASVGANSTDNSHYVQFPFTFKVTPVVLVSLKAGSADYYDGWAEQGSTTASQVRLTLINRYSSSVTMYAQISVHGRWK